MNGSLHGVRVIDLTASVAGPFATMILGDLGADVIKVERTAGGDDTRHWGPPFIGPDAAMFVALNRNKRSLALDLKDEAGRNVLRDLLRNADVLVQNMRPGSLKRLGFGHDDLMKLNPRVIHCDMTGFGPSGPLKDSPAYDPLMQGFGGLMSLTGEDGRPPVRIPASILDQGTGMWAAIGVLDALRTREATGRGANLHTSLLQTSLMWLPSQITGYLATGKVPKRQGSGVGGIVPYQAFPTQDDYILIAAGNEPAYRKLCTVLGCEELAADPRFSDNARRVANREALCEVISGVLRNRPRAHWLQALSDAGVPNAPIQTLDEVLAHEQVVATGTITAADHPTVEDFKIIHTPIVNEGAYYPVRNVAPFFAQHTLEILNEIGYDEAKVRALLEAGVIATGSAAAPAKK